MRRPAVAVLLAVALGASGCTPADQPAPTPETPIVAQSSRAPVPTPSPSPVVEPHDTGSRAYARGSAEATDDGYRYTVAKGDTVVGIAYRFGICNADVFQANGDGGPDMAIGEVIEIRRVTDELVSEPECHL